MYNSPYHEDLADQPFLLGRHGESPKNAGDTSQGRGENVDPQVIQDAIDAGASTEEIRALENGLTDKGVAQIEASVPALRAAGVDVRHVSHSGLNRAEQSAAAFVAASDEPKPAMRGVVGAGTDAHIKEISQAGWEGKPRPEVKELRKEARRALLAELTAAGMTEDLAEHAEWLLQLGGEGETPLEGALRGIAAVEQHGPLPGELIHSHAMLNRYMDAIATTVGGADREELARLLQETSAIGRVAVLAALRDMGVKAFKTSDHDVNRQANGGATEYTVDHATGRWIAGRRIEPPKPGEEHEYVEHRRNAETGQWERATPGGAAGDNE